MYMSTITLAHLQWVQVYSFHTLFITQTTKKKIAEGVAYSRTGEAINELHGTWRCSFYSENKKTLQNNTKSLYDRMWGGF